MKTIYLYQIPFSHFCDKVRWSLDFYSIPCQTINYAGPRTPGLEKAPRTLQKLTPIIEDPNNEYLFGELGLYARRLAYLYVISEQPAILSVFVDGNYDKTSCDDWKSYFRGLMGCCIVMARLGIHQIKEENIFEKTICLLDEIKQNIDGKQYLFNNQFTAADLTLTALIRPLTLVTPIFIKYKSIFEYCDRIRELHDPKPYQDINVLRLFKNRCKKRQSTIRNIIWFIFYILFYPLGFFFNTDVKKSLLQYPSKNLDEKANNDVRILKFNSIINMSIFLIKYFWHLCFTLPKQMEFVNNEGNKILHRNS